MLKTVISVFSTTLDPSIYLQPGSGQVDGVTCRGSRSLRRPALRGSRREVLCVSSSKRRFEHAEPLRAVRKPAMGEACAGHSAQF
jgi:hypothetical protein